VKIVTLALIAVLLFVPGLSIAQTHGPMYQVNVRGLPMNCTSYFGEPVAIFLNGQLDNVGIATILYNGAPAIVINPNVTNSFSNVVAQWWFAHECAHHALPPNLNNESNADCFAIKQLVQFGIINMPQQLNAFKQELATLPGSPMGHLPGPVRANHIVQCALQ
jgi:hypothetical protein